MTTTGRVGQPTVALLTIGEALGVAATEPGTSLGHTAALRLSTAGAEATVAIGVRRLGLRSAWVGTVGADEIGSRVLRDLSGEGVDTRFIRRVEDRATGFMLRDHSTPDFTTVSYYRRGLAGSQLSAQHVRDAFDGLGSIAVLHLTGLTPLLSSRAHEAVQEAVTLAGRAGTSISCDVNYRAAVGSRDEARAVMAELLPHLDLLFVGEDELDLVTDETDPQAAVQALSRQGISEVVAKLGGRGALASLNGDVPLATPALPVTVVDVIGAGDSFVAGYLAARHRERDLTTRLRWGTTSAACTVGTRGDWEGLPQLAQIDRRQLLGVTTR